MDAMLLNDDAPRGRGRGHACFPKSVPDAVTSAQRIESDPPTGTLPWPRIILVDSDPTRARRRRIALTRCGFPAVDVVHDVDEVDEAVNRCGQQRLALVVLTAAADSAPVIAALRAAGCAQILAISPTREVGRIISAVGAGATGVMITPGRVDSTGSASGIELSSLQIAIIELVAQGRSNHAIGEELGLPESTVKNHLIKIGCKFYAGDRAHRRAQPARRRHRLTRSVQ